MPKSRPHFDAQKKNRIKSHSIIPDGRHNFGSTEHKTEAGTSTAIALADFTPSDQNADPLAPAIERCHSENGSKGLFADAATRKGLLNGSYVLAKLLVQGGQPACDQTLQHAYFVGRPRKRSNQKPFLVAVELAAKPTTVEEFKTVSDYAAVLEHAHDQGIEPDGLANFLDDTPQPTCLQAVRSKRAAAKLAKSGADNGRPKKPQTFSAIKIKRHSGAPITLTADFVERLSNEVEDYAQEPDFKLVLEAIQRVVETMLHREAMAS